MSCGLGIELAANAAEPKALKVPEGVVFDRDVVYGNAGGTELLLNLARPAKATGPRPAVLVIHGGGWAGGNRGSLDDMAIQFASRGYVSATISYRLAPKHLFPAQVEDAKCAVRFLRANAEKYQIQADAIGAIGMSAGAHLAMMLGVMDPADGLEGEGGWKEYQSKIQAVVSFVGPTDLAAEDLPVASQAILRNFLGGSRAEKLEDYRRASPIQYVDASDAPMLMLQGTKDPLIPNTQAYRMSEALSAAGVRGRIELMLGAGHGWGGKEMEESFAAMFRFLDGALKTGSAP